MDSLRSTPAASADELDGGEIVFGAFVISRGDVPEMLDPVEEALDEIALPVKPSREGEALLAVGARRDVGPGVLAGDGLADGVAVVALVCEQCRAFLRIDGYAVVDLRAGVEAADGSWRGQVWGRNVGNKFYIQNAAHYADAITQIAAMPATYGVSLSFRY